MSFFAVMLFVGFTSTETVEPAQQVVRELVTQELVAPPKQVSRPEGDPDLLGWDTIPTIPIDWEKIDSDPYYAYSVLGASSWGDAYMLSIHFSNYPKEISERYRGKVLTLLGDHACDPEIGDPVGTVSQINIVGHEEHVECLFDSPILDPSKFVDSAGVTVRGTVAFDENSPRVRLEHCELVAPVEYLAEGR